jgi:hypothetical protein
MLDPGPARVRRLQSPASLCDHDSKIAFAAARIIAVLERALLIQLSNAEVGEVLAAVSTSSMTGGRIMGPVSGDTSVGGLPRHRALCPLLGLASSVKVATTGSRG